MLTAQTIAGSLLSLLGCLLIIALASFKIRSYFAQSNIPIGILANIVLISSISLYGIAFARPISQLIGIFLLFLAALITTRNHASSPTRRHAESNYFELIFIAISAILIWGISVFFSTYYHQGVLMGLSPNADVARYSANSQTLRIFQAEAPRYEHFGVPLAPEVYHYIESWAVVPFVYLTGMSDLVVMKFIINPLFLSCLVWGSFGVSSQTGLPSKWSAIAAILTLFACGTSSALIGSPNILQGSETFQALLLYDSGYVIKILPTLLIAIICLSFWLKGHKWAAFYISLSLPFANPTLTPSVFGLALVFLTLEVKSKIKLGRNLNKVAPIIIYVASLLLFYYVVQRSAFQYSIIPKNFTVIEGLLVLWRNIVAKSSIQICFTNALNIIILIIIYRNIANNKNYYGFLLSILVLLVGGMVGWMSSILNPDSVQLVSNVNFIIFVVLTLFAVSLSLGLMLSRKIGGLSFWTLALLLLLIGVHGVSTNLNAMLKLREIRTQGIDYPFELGCYSNLRNIGTECPTGFTIYNKHRLNLSQYNQNTTVNRPANLLMWESLCLRQTALNVWDIDTTTAFGKVSYHTSFLKKSGYYKPEMIDNSSWLKEEIRSENVDYVVIEGSKNLTWLNKLPPHTLTIRSDSSLSIAWLTVKR